MRKNEGRTTAERSIGLGLFLAGLVVVCLVLLVFVQTNLGQRFFADAGSSTSLLRADRTGKAKRTILEPGARRRAVKRLGTVELDAHSRYLFVADLGNGGRVNFVGRNRGTQVRIECPARHLPAKCQRVFSARGAPGEFDFRAVYPGKSSVVVERATVARLSPVYLSLIHI